MPGSTLSFRCPCGFRKNDIGVGVADDFVHYSAFLCLTCKKIIPVLKRRGGAFNEYCHACGTKFVPLTAPGAWVPGELQRRFPGSEPWMVENSIFNLEEEEAEKLMPLAGEIRVLCPRCQNLSLQFEETGCWD